MNLETLRRVSRMVGREINRVSDLTPMEIEALLNAKYSGDGDE